MPLLVCDNSFSVNIAALDSEHSRLVGMLNVLSECVARGEGKEVAAPMLTRSWRTPKLTSRQKKRCCRNTAMPDLPPTKPNMTR